MTGREYPDGRIVFPIKGKPPPDIPGYERVPGNKYVFRPILIQCDYRQTKKLKVACCATEITYYTCSHGWKVTRRECQRCVESGRRDL